MKFPFGYRIRKVREEKGFTLKEIAEKVGVSESLISQIERDKVSPAIDTLFDIATALDIDIPYIFADYKKKRDFIIIRKNERDIIKHKNVVYELLSSKKNEEKIPSIDGYQITIAPGGKSESGEYGHDGFEFGVVLSGTADISFANELYELREGDSIRFESSLPHTICNHSDKPFTAYWVVSPPKTIFRANTI